MLIYFLCKSCNPLKKVTRFPAFSFVYCLTRNTLFINLLLLWGMMHFQKKTNFFLKVIAGWFWFCCFVYVFLRVLFHISAYHKTTNSFIFVYFLLYIHIGLSWHNHVENSRLFLFYRFPRKLSSRLVLPP